MFVRAINNLELKLRDVEAGHDKLVEMKAELDVEKQKNPETILVSIEI